MNLVSKNSQFVYWALNNPFIWYIDYDAIQRTIVYKYSIGRTNFMKRKILAAVAIASIILCNGNSVQACDKTPECYSTSTIAICGTLHGTHAYTHVVTEPNGYTYSCSVDSESSVHTIKCAGC